MSRIVITHCTSAVLVGLLLLLGSTSLMAQPRLLHLMESVEVYSFGHNFGGRLGHGDEINRLSPIKIEGLSGVTAVAASHHSLILRSNGEVYSFGSNRWGQLGLGDKEHRSTPTKIEGIGRAKAIAAGERHSLIVLANGDVYAFGNNNSGQLGLGDTNERLTPVKIQGLRNAKAVAVGVSHSLVLLDNGQVYSFGSNAQGQLGQGALVGQTSHTPARIMNLDKAKAISAGDAFSLVLLQDGDVYTFGNNRLGQLGYETDGDSNTVPTRIRMPGPAKSVVAGAWHSLVLLENGRLYSFGANGSGQLGHGDTEQRSRPTRIADLDKVTVIAAGSSHSLAALENGEVYSFGSGAAGRLGHGNQNTQRNPALIETLPGDKALDLSAGFGHSLVLIAMPPALLDVDRLIETDRSPIIRQESDIVVQ